MNTPSQLAQPTAPQYTFNIDASTDEFEIKVDSIAGYGYFEHNIHGDNCGGGLWFDGLQLTDYDSVTELPLKVAMALRIRGFIVSDDFAGEKNTQVTSPVSPTPDGTEDGTISTPHVMKSQAGFYVGTTKMSDGMWVPCDRFSDYFCDQARAQSWLDIAIHTGGL